jgi:hypothetical protein
MSEASTIPGLLGPPTGYTDILDGYLIEKERKAAEGPRRWNPLRPSASGHCARKLAYEFNEYRGNAKYPGEIKAPSVQRLLSLGHSIEWNILRFCDEVPEWQVKYKQQVLSFFKYSETEWVEGSLDFVLWSPEYKVVGDVKSKGDRAAKGKGWGRTKWDDMDDTLAKMSTVQRLSDTAFWVDDLPSFLDELDDPFFADNFIQLNMYANSDFLKERGVDHAFVLQSNKNDSRIREVRFRPSELVYEYVKTKYLSIADAIDRHKDPERVEREYSKSSIRCKYCPFKAMCWAKKEEV